MKKLEHLQSFLNKEEISGVILKIAIDPKTQSFQSKNKSFDLIIFNKYLALNHLIIHSNRKDWPSTQFKGICVNTEEQ